LRLAYIDFFAAFNLAGFVGDERRVRARDPRRPRAIQVTTCCVPSAVPAAEFRFGGVVGPPWFLRAADDFPHDASELPGGNTGRCGTGSVLQFVCCVFGAIPNAFWHLGSMHSGEYA